MPEGTQEGIHLAGGRGWPVRGAGDPGGSQIPAGRGGFGTEEKAGMGDAFHKGTNQSRKHESRTFLPLEKGVTSAERNKKL